ncbi:hypothetical protein Bca52824_026239 [Brassica carinata]|uniref:Uncharacterized protein n=1 Tax=Brassica carinata TaxID=52824 RepID=A0A8X7SHD4_BRACI|nr:hypothetical protein Bca52824_026239 [Brassica carinata]
MVPSKISCSLEQVPDSPDETYFTSSTREAVKDNVRPNFSFHSHAHGETSSKISDMAEYLEPPDDNQAAIEEDPIAESPNDCDEISDNTEDAISKLIIPPPDKIRLKKKKL